MTSTPRSRRDSMASVQPGRGALDPRSPRAPVRTRTPLALAPSLASAPGSRRRHHARRDAVAHLHQVSWAPRVMIASMMMQPMKPAPSRHHPGAAFAQSARCPARIGERPAGHHAGAGRCPESAGRRRRADQPATAGRMASLPAVRQCHRAALRVEPDGRGSCASDMPSRRNGPATGAARSLLADPAMSRYGIAMREYGGSGSPPTSAISSAGTLGAQRLGRDHAGRPVAYDDVRIPAYRAEPAQRRSSGPRPSVSQPRSS